jgi:AraC-like DNA-binding protein
MRGGLMFNNIKLQKDMELITEGRNCKIYKFKSEDGYGMMTMYHVFNGIMIMYNDFHMSSCKSEFFTDKDLLCVDHCREGRIEQEMENGTYCYIKSGDLKIDDRYKHDSNFFFPLSNYHGMNIIFEIEKADKELKKIFPDFPVSMNDLKNKYFSKDHSFIIRNVKPIDHIFSELYTVPQRIRDYYFKIKIFELLLFLDGLELSQNTDERPYFYKAQTEKVKAIHNMLISNLQRSYTLDELARKYDISLTGMKNCFKGIYGDPIFTYIRKYKMNKAAGMLRTTKLNVSKIALQVGYENPSKFSAAFKQEMRVSPMEYRKSIIGKGETL